MMREYLKINTVYNRDSKNNFKTLLEGQFSMPEFEYLKDCQWIFTEKVNGTNIRVMFDGENITFGGKTDRAQIPAPLVNKLNEIFLPQIKMCEDNFADGVCLYGEGHGAKIQKGGENYRQDQSFVLFDVKIGDWWLQRKDVESISTGFGIDIVPIIGKGTLLEMIQMVRQGTLVSKWSTKENLFLAEGIVARPAVELKTRSGQRIITKIKYKDFKEE